MTRVLPGHHRDMVTLFPTGTLLILVTLVVTLASSLLGDSGSTWASPGTCDSDPSMASPDLMTVVPIGTSPGPHDSGPTGASPGPGVSGTHMGSIRIWLHCSLTMTQPDLLTLVFTWATPGHGGTISLLGLTWTCDSDPCLILTCNW